MVELLICGILTIFFLFYFNRLIATAIAYAIRAYTWRAFHAYIDITSLQISLLGGRIFFKDIRYHGHNETILVHGGYITWNYWLRRVREAAVSADRAATPDGESTRTSGTPSSSSRSRGGSVDKAEKGGQHTQKQLPCRISVKISGLEAFMYNRSPAYDMIINAVQRKAATTDQEKFCHGSAATTGMEPKEQGHQHNRLRKTNTVEPENTVRPDTGRLGASDPGKTNLPAFLRLLPIHVDVNKGAVVIGNENTLAVITAQCDKASGTVDASTCGPLDVYQQLFKFDITHPVVHMKPNPDYKMSQLDKAAQLKQEASQGVPQTSPFDKHAKRKQRWRWWRKLSNLSGLFDTSADSIHTHTRSPATPGTNSFTPQWHFPGRERWKGLARYLDDDTTDSHGEWDGIEYAKTSLIADLPKLSVSFYWDVSGPVPYEMDNSVQLDARRPPDINGSLPPAYGVDIQVFGGTINYGPWADRHRAIFQNIFFPASHVDAVPAVPLKPGEPRLPTVFNLFLSIEEDTVLRIPIREPSKDWKWKGKAHTLAAHEKAGADKGRFMAKSRRRWGNRHDNTGAQNVRPFGWIDVKVGANTTVSQAMDMYASSQGFQSKLEVEIPKVEISSSVNHGLLWRSGLVTLNCDLSTPLGWNKLRKWSFKIKCYDLELFLLRDHLFLLTDLIADWGTGPPPDYFLFVPFVYSLNIDFENFSLYMNTNDSNIVNNPADLDDNNFVILFGERLQGDVIIPLDKFRPMCSDIRFDIHGHNLGLEILMPTKNTLKTFLHSPKIAHLGGLTLTGSHTFVNETSAMNTDRLYMDIQGHKLTVELYGWLVHHFMKIKDNYFGEDMHFKTLEEFQGSPSVGHATESAEPNTQPAKIANDLDVILCIAVDQASVLVPSNLYSAERSIRADVPYVSADLRFTNYYMDLVVDFSPISLSLSSPVTNLEMSTDFTSGATELFIDSVGLFGHRLFGLPPDEPTYLCNWDFEVGKISGECSAEFLETATGAVRSFAFTLEDHENSLPLTEIPLIHDSTFLRLKMADVNIWLHIARHVLLIRTSPVTLTFNDLAGNTFSERLTAYIPDLIISVLDAKSALRHKTRAGEEQSVDTCAYMQTTLSLNMLTRKLDFSDNREKQHAHMRMHDRRTLRTQHMFVDDRSTSNRESVKPPAMQYPDIPHPIFLYVPHAARAESLGSSQSGSSSLSSRGRRLRPRTRNSSSASLRGSIRSMLPRKTADKTAESSRSRTLLDGSPERFGHERRTQILAEPGFHKRDHLTPLSVALSSSLAMPKFALDNVQPDMTEVPTIPLLQSTRHEQDENGSSFNDMSTNHLDENFTHTSILVSTESGVRFYCTPAFVRCVSDLVDLVQPKRPEDILDDFQVNVMTRILSNRNRLEGKGSSLEISVRVPFTHIRFQHSFETHVVAAGDKDQYDVILNQLKMNARIKHYPGERAGENSLSLHTTLGSLGVSVAERNPYGPSQDVAIQAEIKEILVWVLQCRESSVNISFRAFDSAVASKKIDYLAALIHRTTLLAERLVAQFVKVEDRQQHRLRYLAWYLTSVQDQYSDPAFLTKASYTLRAARDHLRGHDSWKIISRFRYTWESLSRSEKDMVLGHCSQTNVKCPADAEQKMITLWDQWRSWDLAHVKQSLAMRLLFGHVDKKLPASDSSPLRVNVKSALIKLTIDPGPRQSEVALRFVATNVTLLPPTKPEGLMLVGAGTPKKSTTIQISSKETYLHIQWEICELVEALSELFQDEMPKAAADASSAPAQLHQFELPDYAQDLHVVFATDQAQLTLDTINLRSVNTGHHFRLSFIDADAKTSGPGEILSVHIHMEVGVSELFARSRSLAKTQYEQPSLYFAMVRRAIDSGVPDEMKVAAASRKIILKVEGDVLGLIETFDNVLKDEVVYFQRQVKNMTHIPKTATKEPKSIAKVTQLPNITLALFMDAYQIELALLQPLGWSITGSSGRISVLPALGKNVKLRVDYDLEASVHRMYSTTTKGSNVISTLQLPPLNGRLTVMQTEQIIKIVASGIVEKVQLQAAEVQALITTFTKPEMSHMLQSVQDDIEVLKGHIDEIFPSDLNAPAIKAPNISKEIMFDIQMTFSGMDINASTPGQGPNSSKANLAFRLSTVQLKATNINADQSSMLYPEASIQVHEVAVEILLVDAEIVRRCGSLTFSAIFRATTEKNSEPIRRVYSVRSSGMEVNVFADTASAVVDVMNHMQDKIKDLDLSKEKQYLQRLRQTRSRISHRRDKSDRNGARTDPHSLDSGALFTSSYSVELLDLQISWIIGTSVPAFLGSETEDLVLSFGRIDLSTQKEDAARLMIQEMRLQMVPVSMNKTLRSHNSALLPEMVFSVAYASTKETRSVAFRAAGKSLDLQLDSHFILPANIIERSIALAGKKFREASANWSTTTTTTTSGVQPRNPFGNKRLASLTVDTNFAGAVVHIHGSDASPVKGSSNRAQQKGKYSQFIGDSSKSSMALRAPGVAIRVEYQDDGHEPSLNAELHVDASTNTLLPTVVPIIIDISDSIKAVVREKDDEKSPSSPDETQSQPKPPVKLLEDDNIITADPTTILGRTRLNMGLRICKQEFSLSCQPIARVTAVAKVEDIYITANSVKSQEHGHFFAASAAFEKIQVTVQHVYSRESTFSLDMDSVVLSLMNSKHLSGTSGISAILKINPTALQINARQLQDFLLFREIWIPPEIRRASKASGSNVTTEPQEDLMHRYQQVTAATAFPWNANVAMTDVKVDIDLGQAIGKSSLHIHNIWASSKKSTTWEQNLCIGVEKIGIEGTGRTSGFIELHGIKVRTSIGWPLEDADIRQTPLIQASIAFHQLRVKTGFDYQAFVMADIADFGFLMYNAREEGEGSRDRLVAILDGGRVHVFCHATSAAQGLALCQAIERLVQENQQAYRQSLRDIEKFLRRKSSVSTPYDRSPSASQLLAKDEEDGFKAPISLHTDVVVTLRSIKFGVFPSTFVDTQLLLLEAGDMQARFAVALEQSKIHSSLGMTLGQLSVALSAVPTAKKSISIAELTVEDVAASAQSARGGTILRVPKVIASMHTWQRPQDMHIDYLFKSSLEGKVDVGWNYNRISFIRTMWSNHSRTLASRLGKPLPESNIKISTSQALADSTSPTSSGHAINETSTNAHTTTAATSTTTTSATAPSHSNPTEKITAVVHVPQSKYQYAPLEPPLIETPQLRDMGEATPPLEWIGLHRDRLPNVTHQIVIVALLEVAREVEDAYGRILGSS